VKKRRRGYKPVPAYRTRPGYRRSEYGNRIKRCLDCLRRTKTLEDARALGEREGFVTTTLIWSYALRVLFDARETLGVPAPSTKRGPRTKPIPGRPPSGRPKWKYTPTGRPMGRPRKPRPPDGVTGDG
jgi:hypothetical protein